MASSRRGSGGDDDASFGSFSIAGSIIKIIKCGRQFPSRPGSAGASGHRRHRPGAQPSGCRSPGLHCTAIEQVDRSLRATSQTKGTAEYAEYAENRMDWVPTFAYFAYSAVSAAALPRCGTGKTPSSLPVSRLCSLKAALLGGRSESALYGNSDMIHLASAIVTSPGRAWSAVSHRSGTR